MFLMENVPNLQAIGKGRLLQEILAEIDNMGYAANHRVLNAAHYGNPQKRRRLIVFGTRKDLGKAAALPAATHSEMGICLARCRSEPSAKRLKAYRQQRKFKACNCDMNR
ncbi:hypothetical protein HC928_18940 [bacterium]|nr:hypothetical protein [bacterium]